MPQESKSYGESAQYFHEKAKEAVSEGNLDAVDLEGVAKRHRDKSSEMKHPFIPKAPGKAYEKEGRKKSRGGSKR